MLSRWERQALHVIDITCHEQSQNTTVHYLESNQNSYSEIELIYVNLKRSNKGKEQLKTSRLEPIGNQALSQNIDWNYENLFKSVQVFSISDPRADLPEPTAISKSCQRPKRNSWARHLHFPSPTTLRFGSLLPNWWGCAAHKSHLRRGGRTWYPDCNWNCTGLDILEE